MINELTIKLEEQVNINKSLDNKLSSYDNKISEYEKKIISLSSKLK
jgi:hypothetical protein